MRLIDADKLLKASRTGKILYFNDTTTDGYTDVLLAVEVEHAPTIEAQPVRCGKWRIIHDSYDRAKEYNCSSCDANHIREYNFCPSCGARMIGGDNST